MIRHKAGLLKRKPQVVEQGTDILTVIEHPELAPNQHADEDRVPTGCLKAHNEWTGLNQLDQAFLLFRRQLFWTTATVVIHQTLHAPKQKGLLPIIETGWTQAPAFA